MHEILVDPLPGQPSAFAVTVSEGSGTARYHVTLASADNERLAPGTRPEHVIEAAFRFLLDREPKELIMSRFDLTVIARQFPEFEAKLPGYLGAGS